MSVPARHQVHLPDLADWFDLFPPLFGTRTEVTGIRVEEYLEGENYVIRAELPGFDPEHDVEITVAGGVLTIRAHRTDEQTDKHHSEFRYGSFGRSLRLPATAKEDSISAAYKDGILTVKVGVDLPKTETKKISVDTAG